MDSINTVEYCIMVYIIYITAQLNSAAYGIQCYHLSAGILNHVIYMVYGALMLGEGLLQLQIKVGTKILCTHREYV